MEKQIKKILICLTVLLASFGLSHVARAQSLDSFTLAPITGDSDVDADGTTALAFDLNEYTGETTIGDQTVNGVVFSNAYLSSNNKESAVQNGYTYTNNFTHQGGATTFDPSTATNPPGASTAYLDVIGGGEYALPTGITTATISFNGLTIGDTYEAQIFAFDARVGSGTTTGKTETITGIDDPIGDSATLTLDGGESNDAEGSYTIATFTAVSTSQTYDISGTDIQVNAVNLRDDGVVPEPATYVMLGLGLAGLVLIRRVRGVKLS